MILDLKEKWIEPRELNSNHQIWTVPGIIEFFSISQLMVLQQIYSWIETNVDGNKGLFEGKYWVCTSLIELSDELHVSMKTIERVLKGLEDIGVLISSNFNDNKLDRKKWYTIDGEIFQKKTGIVISPYRHYDFINVTNNQLNEHSKAPTQSSKDENITVIQVEGIKKNDNKVEIITSSRKFLKRKGRFRYRHKKRTEYDKTMSEVLLYYVSELYYQKIGVKHDLLTEKQIILCNEKLLTFAYYWLRGSREPRQEFHEEIYSTLVLMATVFLEDENVCDHSFDKFVTYKNLEKYLRAIN